MHKHLWDHLRPSLFRELWIHVICITASSDGVVMWTHWTQICSEETWVKTGSRSRCKKPQMWTREWGGQGAGGQGQVWHWYMKNLDPNTLIAWASWSLCTSSCLPSPTQHNNTKGWNCPVLCLPGGFIDMARFEYNYSLHFHKWIVIKTHFPFKFQ